MLFEIDKSIDLEASESSLLGRIRHLYNTFGQRKPMGRPSLNTVTPHYFLLRKFISENDLLIILSTKRCRYQCQFCQLPAKSSKVWISGEDILAQFEYVLNEMKHALSVIDRLTLSNEGSVLDADTLPTETLLMIAKGINEIRNIRKLVLETRLEFVDPIIIQQIREVAPRVKVDILTGFETYNSYIRDKLLFKRESIEAFLTGLDRIAEVKAELTSYVLFKSSPTMTDDDAYTEAEETIDFLANQCLIRKIPLTIRLNPMYLAKGSVWAKRAHDTPDYKPPRLTDIMRLAEKKVQKGLRVYIGLSTEGLDEDRGNYTSREDYSPGLIGPIKLFNDGKISSFDWEDIVHRW